MLSQPSFNFESETFIKTNRCFVVCIDFELESGEVEPVVCEIDDRAHELFANAFALPVLMHGDSNHSGVFPAWAVWKRRDMSQSDDAAFNECYEVVNAIGVFRQSPSPVLTRRIW